MSISDKEYNKMLEESIQVEKIKCMVPPFFPYQKIQSCFGRAGSTGDSIMYNRSELVNEQKKGKNFNDS